MEEAVPVAHTKFRLQGRAIFLTWPQNAATKEDTLAACVQQWPSATFIVVAEEEHKTGDPHLHAVIQFEKRVDMKDCMPMLDALTGKHGNYQNVRSAKRVLKYVCKGSNFISHGDVPDLEDKEKLQDGVAKMIMEGETYKDVVARNPGFAMMQKRKIEEFVGWAKRQKLASALLPWIPPTINDYLGQPSIEIALWLHNNIMVPRQPRQKQLWLWGPPGIGKTRFLSYLRARLRVYDMPKDEDFYDGYEDGCYDLVVMDEFKSHKKIQFLNAWCDGQPLPLRQKGCQSVKNDNLPLIVCSNFSIENCYHEGIGRDALVDRFNVVRMEKEFEFK